MFVLFDGVQLLDVAGAADVFTLADAHAGRAGYQVTFVSASRRLTSSAGLGLTAAPLDAAPRTIHTLIVPGAPQPALERALADARLMAWLRARARRSHRVASICSGAFLIGATGLLDGRRATTHWMALDRLGREFPRADVLREALFVEDGTVWTSAGVTTGIDLTLALVSRDLGPDIALAVARDLVMHLVRPGGQSQFSAPLSLQAKSGPDLDRLIPWLERRLQDDIGVEQMAAAMGMSERNFHRRCIAAFDRSPGKLLAELRFDRARALLGDRRIPVQTVAARSGFTSAAAFSKAFAKRYGTSPSSYRRGFGHP